MPHHDSVDRATTPAGDRSAIEVIGDDRLTLSRTALEALPTVERELTVDCASGDRTTATWTGVPVSELLARADAPPATTHLRLTSDDGYRACVGIGAALDALVAVARDHRDLRAVERYGTRFVGADVAGDRSVKGPTRIETVALDPGEDPRELESDDAGDG